MSEENKTFNTLKRAYGIIALIPVVPCAISLVGLVILITIYVIGSSFLNLQWLFVEEITEFWLVAIGYLSLSYALLKGRHVITDFMVIRLPVVARQILKIFTSLLSMLAVSYLTWRAIEWFVKGWERHIVTSSQLQTPFWPFYLIVVIGLFTFLLGLALELPIEVINLVKHKDYTLKEKHLTSEEELEELR